MRLLSVTFLVVAACAADPTGVGGDDGGDDAPVDACPCPGGDAGGGGGDGGDPPGGCDGDGSAAAQPFGNHAASYASGSILPDHLSQSQLDDQVRGFYDEWKSRYLEAGCGAGRWYVATGHDASLTVSEAHGYGMLILAFLAGHDPDARTIFDGMVRYYQDHPSEITPPLMAWSQDWSCNNNEGAAAASDGDLDIAYALLLADKQWSSGGELDYRGLAEQILDGIRAGEVDGTGSYILLGDWTSGPYYDATRSSDFMPGHFASFAAATGDGAWSELGDRSYEIMEQVQSAHAPATGLLPDFIASPLDDPGPVPPNFLERPVDGEYSYNACRDPWRIALDFLTHGDTRARAMVERMNDWIIAETGGDPTEILPGYSLEGGGLGGTYYDPAFVAPFGVAAMVDGAHQDWLNAIWDSTIATRDTGYYGDTVAMLSLIAMSGNWWAPESAPCP
jgi:endo-1,4-beta-D-glucanase Y